MAISHNARGYPSSPVEV